MPSKTRQHADDESAPGARNYSRWRVATLTLVYLLMGLHFAHWKIAGRTLAPLELNEVMHTLELGIVTAGFIFMSVAVVSVLIFGRFFCSWGCHILALEDLSAWLLSKVGIRPKPVRARVLLLVPVAAVLYMFVWPQIKRLIEGRPPPALHIAGETTAWASFMTDDFARNLPGPGVTIFTFIVVGFIIIYFLGSRSFCKYACPYGAVFSLADRVAPGKIVSRGSCSDCGLCTAQCQSNIRVHEELTVYGRVVSPSCLKDLDCVSVCPENNIAFGFTKPAGFLSWKKPAGIKRPRYDFTVAEEGLMVAVFLATLLVYRGLYGLIPFLLTLALGGIFAYGAVLGVRLVSREHVRLNNFQLKRAGRVSRPGAIFAGLAVAIVALSVHSAYIRSHEYRGWQAADVFKDHRQAPADRRAALESAISHLSTARSRGLYAPPALNGTLQSLHGSLAQSLAAGGDLDGAIKQLESAVADFPDSPLLHYNLGVVLTTVGRTDEAKRAYEAAIRLDPTDAHAHNNLGFLFLAQEKPDDAERSFETATRLDPEFANAHYNLARVLSMKGQSEEALSHLRRAAAIDAIYARFLPATDN
jgi:Flp pilus assembly protein TadD/polyferredoxin